MLEFEGRKEGTIVLKLYQFANEIVSYHTGLRGSFRQRDYFRPIPSNNGGLQIDKLQTSNHPELRSSGRHWIENPRLPGLHRQFSGDLHSGQPGGGKRADIDTESIGVGSEIRQLLDGMKHGRRGSGG